MLFRRKKPNVETTAATATPDNPVPSSVVPNAPTGTSAFGQNVAVPPVALDFGLGSPQPTSLQPQPPAGATVMPVQGNWSAPQPVAPPQPVVQATPLPRQGTLSDDGDDGPLPLIQPPPVQPPATADWPQTAPPLAPHPPQPVLSAPLPVQQASSVAFHPAQPTPVAPASGVPEDSFWSEMDSPPQVQPVASPLPPQTESSSTPQVATGASFSMPSSAVEPQASHVGEDDFYSLDAPAFEWQASAQPVASSASVSDFQAQQPAMTAEDSFVLDFDAPTQGTEIPLMHHSESSTPVNEPAPSWQPDFQESGTLQLEESSYGNNLIEPELPAPLTPQEQALLSELERQHSGPRQDLDLMQTDFVLQEAELLLQEPSGYLAYQSDPVAPVSMAELDPLPMHPVPPATAPQAFSHPTTQHPAISLSPVDEDEDEAFSLDFPAEPPEEEPVWSLDEQDTTPTTPLKTTPDATPWQPPVWEAPVTPPTATEALPPAEQVFYQPLPTEPPEDLAAEAPIPLPEQPFSLGEAMTQAGAFVGAGVATASLANAAAPAEDSFVAHPLQEPASSLEGKNDSPSTPTDPSLSTTPAYLPLSAPPVLLTVNDFALDAIQVIQTHDITAQHRLYVANVGERYVLIGQTAGKIELLKFMELPVINAQTEFVVAEAATSATRQMVYVKVGNWQGHVLVDNAGMMIQTPSAF